MSVYKFSVEWRDADIPNSIYQELDGGQFLKEYEALECIYTDAITVGNIGTIDQWNAYAGGEGCSLKYVSSVHSTGQKIEYVIIRTKE